MPKKFSGQAVAVATGLWPVNTDDDTFWDGPQSRGYNVIDDRPAKRRLFHARSITTGAKSVRSRRSTGRSGCCSQRQDHSARLQSGGVADGRYRARRNAGVNTSPGSWGRMAADGL